MYKKRRGFTLIELLVVVAILAILMAIAIPRFSSVSDNAKITADQANHRMLKSAAAAYIASGGGSANWSGEAGQGWDAYIEEWPEHPIKEENYTVSIGEDGKITIEPIMMEKDN